MCDFIEFDFANKQCRSKPPEIDIYSRTYWIGFEVKMPTQHLKDSAKAVSWRLEYVSTIVEFSLIFQCLIKDDLTFSPDVKFSMNLWILK